jgi:hypothetical protein
MTSRAKPALEVGAECFGGHRGEETPRRFTLGRTIEVAEVLNAWLAHRNIGTSKSAAMVVPATSCGTM